MRRRISCGLAFPLALLILCGCPCGAGAIELGSELRFEFLNKNGEAETRAGAHPDRLIETFLLAPEQSEDAKELVIDLPPGLSGNADAVPACVRRSFSETSYANPPEECPEASRVGSFKSGFQGKTFPLYRVEPGPNELAVFGATQFFLPTTLIARLRPADLGMSLSLRDIPNALFTGGEIELWGVPADHQQGTELPRRPFLSLPTTCDGSIPAATVNLRSWQEPEVWVRRVVSTGQPLTGCRELAFSPHLDFGIDDRRADVPSGAEASVVMPEDVDPDGTANSMIRGISIALPEGLTVAPSGASRLVACSDADFDLGGQEDPHCPPASRIGSVKLTPSGGGKPLEGSLFIGEEHPGDRFRVLLTAEAPGAEVKLNGSLRVDAKTGRMTVELGDLPEAAFEDLRLRFDGGPRSLLATPLKCGSVTAEATFTPYSGEPDVQSDSSVGIDPSGGGSCAGRFTPALSAGSTNALAGRSTTFTATIRRRDGEELPKELTIALPPGFSAELGTVEPCGSGAAGAGSCPAASRIGSAVAELGPGGEPARLGGDIYLTDGYRGGPYGVALVFDAAIGPFDLGRLVVRGALRVDRLSGQLSVKMNSLPTSMEGVPLRFQTIGFDLDRPGFMVNPTSCAATQLVASLRSQDGTMASASSPFALHRCVGLPFRPRLSAALGNPGQLHKGGRPSLRLSMRMARAGANLRSVAVRLPAALELKPKELKELCSRRRAETGRCPKESLVGSASARTPLLSKPMKGSVFLVQPAGKGSPDIWASVRGQGLEFELQGRTVVSHGRAQAHFVDLPDFPLRSLDLRLRAGKAGVFELNRRPCGRLLAPATMIGQNEALLTARLRLRVPTRCGRHG